MYKQRSHTHGEGGISSREGNGDDGSAVESFHSIFTNSPAATENTSTMQTLFCPVNPPTKMRKKRKKKKSKKQEQVIKERGKKTNSKTNEQKKKSSHINEKKKTKTKNIVFEQKI